MNKSISQCGQRFQYDVLVIGAGVAGLSYIIELVKTHPNVRIALLCKDQLSESNTFYAQGGIAAACVPQGKVATHITDTLNAGDGLNDESAVAAIIEQGQMSIDYLLEQGVPFDRDENNQLACGKEAGHTERRIYHCGDKTGALISNSLVSQVKKLKQVTCHEYHIAVNLITQIAQHQPAVFPEVIGAYVLDEKSGLIHTVLANITILATGGAGKIYRYTSNPAVATGDGVAMAYRAGARVGGLEFYQFHPTLFYHPKLNNFLISEALRGEGAYLRLADSGERFMQRYAPDVMELATRDVVSRAIFSEIERTQNGYVHLDIRHQPKEFLQQRFPVIYNTLFNLGLDLSKDLIPVVPAAHYMCGGVLTDPHGTSDLRRLLVIGETAFTGLHGANRLASNSLLEGVVMGRNAARASATWLNNNLIIQSTIKDWDSASATDLRRASQIHVHWRGLRGEMSSYAGIVRTEAGLRDQLKLIVARRQIIEDYYWQYTVTRDLLELRNISLVAELIVRSALSRRESRGGHYREDYPFKAKNSYESILKRDDLARVDIL